MTNKNNTVIYVGVTSDLLKRVHQHKTKTYKGFTAKYNCDKLIYFEEFDAIKLLLPEKNSEIWQQKTKRTFD